MLVHLKNKILFEKHLKKKGIFILVLIVICILLSSNSIFAAEVLYEIERSVEPQDALVIGKVERIDRSGYVEFYVIRLVSGELDSNTFCYQFSNKDDFSKVSIGDTFLLAVEKDNGDNMYKASYEVCYHVKVDENTKIRINEKIDSSGEIIELEWFCNTGDDLMEIRDGEYYEIDAETRKETLVFDMKTQKWYKDSTSESYCAPDVIRERNERYWSRVVFLIVVCLSFCLFAYLFIRTRYKRKKIQGKM